MILGLGIGLAGVVCPMYVAEMAPESKTGFLNSLFQLAITIGISMSYAVGYVLLRMMVLIYLW